jgi:chemosensory pili system protein ChpA (sensor histidine kinase/response regulator)
MSGPSQEFVELFLQEASEHLQFLREYSGILLDPYPMPDDIERLYISAHGIAGTAASYGYPLFAEVASKLAHIFQYAMNATISQDASAPLVEFITEGIAVLESDLIMVSGNGAEAAEDIEAFKQRYPFAFQAPTQPEQSVELLPQPTAPEAVPATVESVAPIETSVPVEAVPSPQELAAAAVPEPIAEEAPLGDLSQELAELAAEFASAPLPDRKPAARVETEEPTSHTTEIPDLPHDGEVPQEVMEFFVPEIEEHLQVVTECLLSLEAAPNPEEINRLFRSMHTIKGSAAQVGLHRISTVAHRAEDLIGRLRDGELRPSASIVDICLEAVDTLKKLLYRQFPDEATLQFAAKSLMSRIARLEPKEEKIEAPAAMAGASAPVDVGTPAPLDTPALTEARVAAANIQRERDEQEFLAQLKANKEPAAMPQSKSVRIALERLDRMMNAVGELVINRTRMLGRLAELERLADVLNFSKARMTDKIAEFQEKYEFSRINTTTGAPVQHIPAAAIGGDNGGGFWGPDYPYRGGYSSYKHGYDASLAEFSELEMDRYDDFGILSRSLTEISADITEVLTQLDGFVRRVDSDIDEFTKLAHRLQDEITQARMVPIGNLYTRISRTVRDAAKASGKQVELTLAGAETELDNNIIQQIADPLLHLVRNSVAHGIEREDERYNAGKPDQGNIAVRAYHRGNHIYIEVEDDGRGIDYEKIRQTAVDTGLVSLEAALEMEERELLDLLFHPGFSTAPRKTELAGRGVGLDVVRSNITQLNGEIEIETQKGIGSRFTLKVPLTLIISQALFVRCGEYTFAFPLAFVEEIRRIRDAEIEDVGGKLLTKVRDVVTEVVRLDAHLGLEPVAPVNGWYRLVIVNVAGRQVGIVVEEVLRKDEIVIKNLGEYLRNVKLFPGATIAPDGSLILLVDINRLIVGEAIERRPLMTAANAARIFAPGSTAIAFGEIPAAAVDIVEREKVVVLADDSISVRKFVGRMLEKAGYRVKLASDGLEALELVTQGGCDLVITDLEMPRTNGYELMMHLRQNPETENIPIMVVTSRAGAKHRDRALKEGGSAFMVKPVQEDQFVAQVQQLIGSSGQSHPAGTLGA